MGHDLWKTMFLICLGIGLAAGVVLVLIGWILGGYFA